MLGLDAGEVYSVMLGPLVFHYGILLSHFLAFSLAFILDDQIPEGTASDEVFTAKDGFAKEEEEKSEEDSFDMDA